jgi:hypothetical protein
VAMTPIKRSSFEMIGDCASYDGTHFDYQAEMASDCGASEASSSVLALRGWLSDFGSKQKDNLPKKASTFQPPAKPLCIRPDAKATDPRSAVKKPAPPRSTIKTPSTKPVRPTLEPVSFAATTLVQRMTTEKPKSAPKKHFSPVRAKHKVKMEKVQATDNTHASVAQLSAWLAEDPTSHKKLRHVRKGRNVIFKSRMFEQDSEGVIVEEAKIERGAVSDKKNFFKNAFRHQEEEEEEHGFAQLKPTNMNNQYAKSEVGGYRDTVVAALQGVDRQGFVESFARSEIVVDDAASSLSVSDKKDWLKSAFKKAEGTLDKKTFSSPVPSKARSDVMHSRSNDRRDDMAVSAKRRFLERSARKLAEKQKETPVKEPSRDEQCIEVPSNSSLGAIMDNNGPEMQPDSEEVITHCSEEREERTAPPADTSKPSSIVELGPHVVEDKASFHFRAARELVINRSKKNGNAVQAINKVHLRKEKFEKIEKDIRRKSGPFGLLKSSWGESNPSTGRPSGAYTKSYVPDIAPKKSFEELP